MILGPAMMENELSDAHRAAAAAINATITTGIIGGPTIVDEAPYVVIEKESNSERETDSLGDELNAHFINREREEIHG